MAGILLLVWVGFQWALTSEPLPASGCPKRVWVAAAQVSECVTGFLSNTANIPEHSDRGVM